jgi:hypothetical protein
MRYLLIASIVGLFFVFGCDTMPDTCKDQSSRQLRIVFKYVTFKDSVTKSVTNRSFAYSYIQFRNNPDSNKLTIPNLPLAQNADTSVFSFFTSNTELARIKAFYKPKRVFENYTCGFRTNFSLDSISFELIHNSTPSDTITCDSIRIVNPTIDDVYKENCWIYLSTISSK